MAYLRTNGRFSGRVSGRWAGASIRGRYRLGDVDISELGTGSQVSGDPILALIAQVNRFAGKTIDPGFGCKVRKYLSSPLAMVPMIDDKTATTALMILYDRYNCVPVELVGPKAKWVTDGLGNAIPFVQSNLNEITTTLAQFGDKNGLPVAAYGITTKAPMFTPSLSIPLVVGGGVLLLAVLVASRRK